MTSDRETTRIASTVQQATIPIRNLSSLRDKVETLNRRAVRLGLEPLTLVLGAESTREFDQNWGVPVIVTYIDVTIIGTDPVLEGWRLLAAVTCQENGENLLRIVPGVEDLPGYWRYTDSQRCDHCQVTRQRKDVFVLRHTDGRETQVGRTCLGDFLGHISPEALIAGAETLFSARDLLNEASDSDPFDSDPGSDRWGIGPVSYLTITAACIRALGWKSRSQAQIEQKPATTDDVACVIFDRRNSASTRAWIAKHGILPVQDRDRDLAKKALDWARALPCEGTSDYLYNLGVAARQDAVTDKTVGLLASAISAYQREVEKIEQAKRENKPESSYIGEPGQKISTLLRLVTSRQIEGYRGAVTLARFEDEQGNIATWFASGAPEWLSDLNGSLTKLKFTIKKHDTYNGQKQTVITRVSLDKKK